MPELKVFLGVIVGFSVASLQLKNKTKKATVICLIGEDLSMRFIGYTIPQPNFKLSFRRSCIFAAKP